MTEHASVVQETRTLDRLPEHDSLAGGGAGGYELESWRAMHPSQLNKFFLAFNDRMMDNYPAFSPMENYNAYTDCESPMSNCEGEPVMLLHLGDLEMFANGSIPIQFMNQFREQNPCTYLTVVIIADDYNQFLDEAGRLAFAINQIIENADACIFATEDEVTTTNARIIRNGSALTADVMTRRQH